MQIKAYNECDSQTSWYKNPRWVEMLKSVNFSNAYFHSWPLTIPLFLIFNIYTENSLMKITCKLTFITFRNLLFVRKMNNN